MTAPSSTSDARPRRDHLGAGSWEPSQEPAPGQHAPAPREHGSWEPSQVRAAAGGEQRFRGSAPCHLEAG
ncbi:hypothetical protein FTX61_05075 [Nitriliruptoraceae bacterium ZYF776]|nr:hypothetical protein [Profundirhabdus halotolerans]